MNGQAVFQLMLTKSANQRGVVTRREKGNVKELSRAASRKEKLEVSVQGNHGDEGNA